MTFYTNHSHDNNSHNETKRALFLLSLFKPLSKPSKSHMLSPFTTHWALRLEE